MGICGYQILYEEAKQRRHEEMMTEKRTGRRPAHENNTAFVEGSGPFLAAMMGKRMNDKKCNDDRTAADDRTATDDRDLPDSRETA